MRCPITLATAFFQQSAAANSPLAPFLSHRGPHLPRIGLAVIALGLLSSCGPDLGPVTERLDRLSAAATQTGTDPLDGHDANPGRSNPPANPAFPPSDSDALEILPGGWVELTLDEAIARALTYNQSLLWKEPTPGDGSLSAADNYLDREFKILRDKINEENPEFTVSQNVKFSRDNRGDRQGTVTGMIKPSLTLTLPTNGTFTVSWTETLNSRQSNTRDQNVKISQPLLKGSGQKRRKDQESQIDKEIDILQLRNAVTGVVNSVITQYRRLVQAYRQLERAESTLERAREQLEETNTLIRVGRVASRDAIRSRASITNQELSLIQTRDALRTSNRALLGTLELDEAIRIRPIEPLVIERRQGGLEPEFEEVLASHVDYQIARLNVERNRIALEKAENNLLPDLGISLTLTRTNSGSTKNTVGADLSIPLDNRLVRIDYLSKRAELLRSERALDDMPRSIQIKLENVVQDIESNLRRIELSRDARELAEEDYAVEQSKFRLGRSSSKDVSASADELVKAEDAEEDAIIAYLDTLKEFDTLTGQTLSRRGITLERFPQ